MKTMIFHLIRTNWRGWQVLRQYLFLLALLVIPSLASAQANLLQNPGFETGDATGWGSSYGGYAVVNSNAHSGAYAAEVGYGSAVAQTVTGLTPNTAYTCTGWLEVATPGQYVYLGAKDFGGTSVSQSVISSTYTQATVTFTTGPTNTSATIFVYQSGTDAAYCDDLSLTPYSAVPTGDATGTQASRIADCLQRFGVNTFSTLYKGYQSMGLGRWCG
ncbi:MAG: carbohydrate binding domain-containing protein [Verrucomicrobiota bacterium]